MGWGLDAFDVMLFSLTLASVIKDLGLTKTQAGALGSITLLAGAAGGLIFGHIADRFGRTRALMGSV
ncbi:MAG: MFS transporter, partial [Gemmatimonadaceae bacterium]